MPEVNFNLLNPSAELYSGPQVQMDPVAAYEKAKATRQSNMLAQLYAKHYDPQTGGVNYNALIPEAAQSGLDVSQLMPGVREQQESMASIAQKRALQQQEEATAAAKQQEMDQANMTSAMKDSLSRLEMINPDSPTAADDIRQWHKANHENPFLQAYYANSGQTKEDATARLEAALAQPGGVKAQYEASKNALQTRLGTAPKPMTEYQQQALALSQRRLDLTEAQLKAKKPSDAAVQQVADMLQAGMTVPMGTSSEFRAAVYGELRNRGASGIDLASAKAAFGGEQQAERTLGATSANQLAASEEAIPMIGIARNYVDRVDTGKFKSVNAISNWAATHTGDKDIIALNTALNSLVNSYARAISPKGIPTVSDKNHAREILDAALSKGQLNTALDVMEQEMQAARTGTTAAKAQIRGQATPPAAGGGAKTPTKSLDDIFKKKTP